MISYDISNADASPTMTTPGVSRCQCTLCCTRLTCTVEAYKASFSTPRGPPRLTCYTFFDGPCLGLSVCYSFVVYTLCLSHRPTDLLPHQCLSCRTSPLLVMPRVEPLGSLDDMLKPYLPFIQMPLRDAARPRASHCPQHAGHPVWMSNVLGIRTPVQCIPPFSHAGALALL